MAQEDKDYKHAIFVTNLSANATQKTVMDFFSFCGTIIYFVLLPNNSSPNHSQVAIVQFDKKKEAKTSILLDSALIIDQVISVVVYDSSIHPPMKDTGENVFILKPPQVVPQTNNVDITEQQQNSLLQETQENTQSMEYQPLQPTQPQGTAVQPKKTGSTVIASLLAAGYILSDDISLKTREFDQKHNITLKAKVQKETAKNKINEFDNKFHISETVQSGVNTASTKLKEFDQQFKVSQKVSQAALVTKASLANIGNKALENETISKGWTAIKNSMSSFKTNTTNFYQETKQESVKIAEQKRQQRRGTTGIPSSPSTTNVQPPVNSVQNTTTTTTLPQNATLIVPVNTSVEQNLYPKIDE